MKKLPAFFLFYFGLFLGMPVFSQTPKDSTLKGDTLKKLPFAIANEKKLPEDELREKKEGVYVTAVPDISQDPINGFGYGAEGSLFFNGRRTDPFFAYTPYRAELAIALFNTTKNQREVKLHLDVPYIFSTKWRLRTEAAYETNPNFLYFGVTEKSLAPLSYFPDNNPSKPAVNNASYDSYDNSLQSPGGRAFYNTYTKTEAVINMSMEHSYLDGRLRALIGYEVAKIDISTPLNDTGSFLHKDFLAGNIKGYGENLITLLQTGLIYDTRDLETDPTKGVFAEITNELSLTQLGSQYNFNKTYIHLNAYTPLFKKTFKRMILAGSFGMGYTQGGAPFFEYPDVWSSEGDIDCMGGGRTLRGYKQARFAAPVMQYSIVELRYTFAQLKLLKQHFAIGVVPFFDQSGVWNDLSRLSHTENIRYSEGLGMRIAWNVNTILRFDYAVSQEDKQFFFQLGHTF